MTASMPHRSAARRRLRLAPLELRAWFEHEGFRIEFTEYGVGDDVVVLGHGLLMSRRMHRQLARRLADDGMRVVTIDLLGHGGSDRPTESWRYSMTASAEQVVALLDHLGVERAVIGGTSLGANVALEAAVLAPSRVRGLLLEMPALDNAVFAGLVTFGPLLFAAKLAPLAVHSVRHAARLIPRGQLWVDVLSDTLQQDPAAMAAVLHGMVFGRIAPPRQLRRQITAPALVIGHAGDAIHPFGDADTLAADMPNARFVRAVSPVELRLRPQRLTGEILEFLRGVFDA